jgi:cysteine desulfurase
VHDPIYLDYNATTPVDPRVVDAMLPYLRGRFGNASSAHAFGHAASVALERARSQVAEMISAVPDEIVFTGGGSESDNLAIQGTVFRHLDDAPHVVSAVTEHPAVLNTLSYLRRRFGVGVTLVPVDRFGCVSPDDVRAALTAHTVLVTLMHANNEVGTIAPIRAIADVCHEARVLLHVDAAQSLGKVPVDVDALGIDLLTIAAHKLYAPKGLGALYVRRGVLIDSIVHGAGQERGRRAGTENVAGAVALGEACAIARAEAASEGATLSCLRDRLHDQLHDAIPGLALNGHPVERLPNTLNVSFPDALGEVVLAYTPSVAASTGSACHAGATDPSPVLMAMGLGVERALGAVRLSLGRWTTAEEIERAGRDLLAGYQAAASLRPGVG